MNSTNMEINIKPLTFAFMQGRQDLKSNYKRKLTLLHQRIYYWNNLLTYGTLILYLESPTILIYWNSVRFQE